MNARSLHALLCAMEDWLHDIEEQCRKDPGALHDVIDDYRQALIVSQESLAELFS